MNLRSLIIASGIALSSAGVANAADAILSQEPTPAIAAPFFHGQAVISAVKSVMGGASRGSVMAKSPFL